MVDQSNDLLHAVPVQYGWGVTSVLGSAVRKGLTVLYGNAQTVCRASLRLGIGFLPMASDGEKRSNH